MPYCILCKMQGVTSPRYRNFLHYRENFCPTDGACATHSRRIGTIAIESAEQDDPGRPPTSVVRSLRMITITGRNEASDLRAMLQQKFGF